MLRKTREAPDDLPWLKDVKGPSPVTPALELFPWRLATLGKLTVTDTGLSVCGFFYLQLNWSRAKAILVQWHWWSNAPWRRMCFYSAVLEVLRSLRLYMWAQSQGHHTRIARLEERDVEIWSARRSSLKGRERAIVSQTNIISCRNCFAITHSSGAVWESRWPSWAVGPNEPSGFRGRKAILNHASALVSACP